MIFQDRRFDAYTLKVKEILFAWKGYRVLDVACGYGRYSDCFIPQDYTGIDFCEEMLKLAAEKYPTYNFELHDIHEAQIQEKYDIVFEVNSLKSLDMSKAEFFEKYSKNATYAIACLEADEFDIRPIYV